MNKLNNILEDSQDYYQVNKKRIWIISVIILLFISLFSVLFFSRTVTAHRALERDKIVASVEVKQGDTLWSIASKYITDEYATVNEYIKEIKDSNGMTSDVIHTGNYIIVPYYADASN